MAEAHDLNDEAKILEKNKKKHHHRVKLQLKKQVKSKQAILKENLESKDRRKISVLLTS
jgi:hypothetical protein